ncbi:cytochrome P450 89A2-like [Magnolia sinica]|uniref:cytochrome P450 89A2-like n=1 Tax=Magnolia sinica TaxID=86752 RepID=UPI002658FF1B|nr:cytochrome P450 89A2-like [Magnolia sinica]
MAEWELLLSFSFFACITLKILFRFLEEMMNRKKLPPGPMPLPVIGNLHQIGIGEIEPHLKKLHDKYGPMITIHQGAERHVFIAGHDIAHQTLIKNGLAFGHRLPSAPENFRLFGGDASEPFIGFTDCGPLWNLFRRNLASKILSPTSLSSFAGARKEIIKKLSHKLKEETGGVEGVVHPLEIFRHVLFSLALFMCFGEKLDDEAVAEQLEAIRLSHQNLNRFMVFHIFPKFGKYLFPKRWKEMLVIRHRLLTNLVPLVQTRTHKMEEIKKDGVFSYADSLIELELPGGGKLRESEVTTLCYEFLTAGVSTVVSSLQWAMANLVKYPNVQAKLYEEIERVTEENGGIIKEEDLKKMPYLKAVILETLRMHPPIHTLLPHRVSEDISLEGYIIPKNTFVNFMLVSMGLDDKVWENPLEFKPERFLGGRETVDLTGTREIKMIPFGAGRRVCPGIGLGMLHLEYMVAHLIKEFEWKGVTGDEVDMAETMEMEIDYVMKKPLKAYIVPRK